MNCTQADLMERGYIDLLIWKSYYIERDEVIENLRKNNK